MLDWNPGSLSVTVDSNCCQKAAGVTDVSVVKGQEVLLLEVDVVLYFGSSNLICVGKSEVA